MKSIFITYLSNKSFWLWSFFFFLALYFIYNPILAMKTQYMEIMNLKDISYLYYVFMLPMTFYELSFVSCIMLDLAYLSIIFYMVVNFVDFFFLESSSSTLTRIDRRDWIKKIFEINLFFSLLISILYISFFFILCTMNDITITLDINIIVIICYKILLTLIIPNVYLLIYLIVNNPLISLLFSCSIYILFEILIKTTVDILSLKFNVPLIILFLLVLIYISTYQSIKYFFQRRDV